MAKKPLLKQRVSTLPKPIVLSVLDYPDFKRLIPGQEVTLKIKVRAGMRNLIGQEELIDLLPTSMEMDDGGRRLSPSEVMLASINDSMNRQTIATP